MVVRVTDVRRPTSDTAVLLTSGGTGHGDVELDKVQTIVLVRRGHEWRVTAFHNSSVAAP
jgi:hypothetical protein